MSQVKPLGLNTVQNYFTNFQWQRVPPPPDLLAATCHFPLNFTFFTDIKSELPAMLLSPLLHCITRYLCKWVTFYREGSEH